MPAVGLAVLPGDALVLGLADGAVTVGIGLHESRVGKRLELFGIDHAVRVHVELGELQLRKAGAGRARATEREGDQQDADATDAHGTSTFSSGLLADAAAAIDVAERAASAPRSETTPFHTSSLAPPKVRRSAAGSPPT